MNPESTQTLMGNRILLIQYTDLLNVLIADEQWTTLRREMTDALLREDRMLMPGIKSANVIMTPEDHNLNETPRVIVSIEGFDDRLYEWEATLVLCNEQKGFKVVGQIHVVGDPKSEFVWTPSKESVR